MNELLRLVPFRLVNGSTGDPALFIDYPGRNDAILFDAGELCALDSQALADLEAVFITHHHVDHFVGFDRILRANLDGERVLSVHGPEGTIRKVYDRIKSYEYQYFAFQRAVIVVHEVLADVIRSADLECERRFPEPQIRERKRKDRVVYETIDLRVESVMADHTTACVAYALVQKPGIYPDLERIKAGPLRPGPWINQALEQFRSGVSDEITLSIQRKPHALGDLRAAYFTQVPSARVAYVTDTAWSDASRPGLLELARGADRLYCDSYYADEHRDRAELHRHMTATQAAEFAREAGVSELVLIHFAPRYQGRYQALVDEASAIFPNVSADLTKTSSRRSPRRTKPC